MKVYHFIRFLFLITNVSILNNFIVVAGDLSDNQENSEYWNFIDEDTRNDFITSFEELKNFFTYGVTFSLFKPNELINQNKSNMRIRDRIRYEIILNKIFNLMKKFNISNSKIKYILQGIIDTVLKREMNGAIDYSKLKYLNEILEEYTKIINKNRLRGILDLDNPEVFEEQMKTNLNAEDYIAYKKLMSKKDFITKLLIRDKQRRNLESLQDTENSII